VLILLRELRGRNAELGRAACPQIVPFPSWPCGNARCDVRQGESPAAWRVGPGRGGQDCPPREVWGQASDTVRMGVWKARDAAASNSNEDDEHQGNVNTNNHDNNQRLRGLTFPVRGR